jgi:hypothetical protein
LFVVSLSDGAIYEIHRVRGGGKKAKAAGGVAGVGKQSAVTPPPTPLAFAPLAVVASTNSAVPPAPASGEQTDPPPITGTLEPVQVAVPAPNVLEVSIVSPVVEPIGVAAPGL